MTLLVKMSTPRVYKRKINVAVVGGLLSILVSGSLLFMYGFNIVKANSIVVDNTLDTNKQIPLLNPHQ